MSPCQDLYVVQLRSWSRRETIMVQLAAPDETIVPREPYPVFSKQKRSEAASSI